MRTKTRLDVTRLLGFATIGDRLAKGVDFKDNMLATRLGAKVGLDESSGNRMDFSRLLGFASLGDQKIIDFRDDKFDGKLGAKVGTGETWAAELLCPNDSSDSDRRSMPKAHTDTEPTDTSAQG